MHAFSLGDVWSGRTLEAADEMGAHRFYRLHCGAADGRKEGGGLCYYFLCHLLLNEERDGGNPC